MTMWRSNLLLLAALLFVAPCAPAVAATWFYDPDTSLLWDNPVEWVAPSGRVWPAGSGALIADNLLERQVRVVIRDEAGAELREVKMDRVAILREVEHVPLLS